jgi:hypothetical protein
MDRREELEQQLWEFVFDLLPAEQAEQIKQRITSDPEVARLYAQTRLQADIVAEAVRLRHPPIPVSAPTTEADDAGSAAPASSGSATRSRVLRSTRLGNSLAAVAASLLMAYLGYAWLRPASPLREVALRSAEEVLVDQPVHTTLLGPEQLQPAPANYFTVLTRTADGLGRQADVSAHFYDAAGELRGQSQCRTDANGIGQLETAGFAPSASVRMVVQPVSTVSRAPAASVQLSVRDVELSTHLATDRPVYRPGEAIRYRTVTLSRYALEVPPPTQVEFVLLDPDEQPVLASRQVIQTETGVASGQCVLPAQTPPGEYRLVARSPDDRFSEVRRRLEVRRYQTPRLKKELDFVRDSYAPGEEVVAELNVQRADGTAAGNVPLEIVAQVDDEIRLNMSTATDDSGRYQIRFDLPERLSRGLGVVQITVGDHAREQLVESIPIHTEAVYVDFFPESGDLVAQVQNRVYFFAHDARGQAVHVQGRILDSDGTEVATLETVRDGRGVFSLVPTAGQRYRLRLDTPLKLASDPMLPETSERQFVTLNTGSGVFAAGAPLEFSLRTVRTDRPVLVTAVCRGSQVGQVFVPAEQLAAAAEADGVCPVSMPLHADASGVIRLTAYAYRGIELTPVAERLVYRRPGRRLEIEVSGTTQGLTPGSQVDLGLRVTDEQGKGRAAVLGVAVVDEATLSLVRDGSASLTTHFWLLGQIDDARGLEDANFYLQEDADSVRALDLLLGTQGWRRFETVSPPQLAAAVVDFAYEDYLTLGESFRPVNEEPTAPQLLVDNQQQAVGVLARELQRLHGSFQTRARQAGRILFIGGLVLVVSLGLLVAARRTTRLVWIPALGASALCLVLGGVWMAARFERAYPLARETQQRTEDARALARAHQPPAAETPLAPRGQPEQFEQRDRRKMGEVAEQRADVVQDPDTAAADLAFSAAKESEPTREAYTAEALPEMETLAEPAPAEKPSAAGRAFPADSPVPADDAAPEFGVRGNNRPFGGGAVKQERLLEDQPAPSAAAAPAAALGRSVQAGRPDAVEAVESLDKMQALSAPAESQLAVPERAVREEMEEDRVPAEQNLQAESMFRRSAEATTRGRAAGLGGALADAERAPSVTAEKKSSRDVPPGSGREGAVGQRALAERAAVPAAPAASADPAAQTQMDELTVGDWSRPMDEAGVAAKAFSPLVRRYASPQWIQEESAARETVYWNPLLAVGADAPVAIRFQLPAAVSRYRLLVNGHTDHRLGSYQSLIDTNDQDPSQSGIKVLPEP